MRYDPHKVFVEARHDDRAGASFEQAPLHAPRAAEGVEAAPPKPSGAAPATVFVLDADASVRDHVEGLIQQSGWRAKSFASGQGFLDQRATPGPCCVILELTLPDLCGLDVQRRLAADRLEMPVIFITDSRDLRIMVQAMKAGAVELLPKPIDCEALLNAVRSALDASRAALAQAAEMRVLQARYASLSCREREVMALVVAGMLNKQVGGELGISEITVKAHRGQVMRKMQARTLVDLVHMSAKLRVAVGPGVEPAPSPGRRP